MKKILLLSYFFPSYPGIGGRRWAKFAKYLARDGYEVHVLCAKNPTQNTSSWENDVLDPKIIREELVSDYPLILSQFPIKTWFQKISYRFNLLKVKAKAKGSPYDQGIYWNDLAYRRAQNILSDTSFYAMIATGAPFSTFEVACKLKKQHPTLRMIADLRDPFVGSKDFEIKNLHSLSRMAYEKEVEAEVLKCTDTWITVADFLTRDYQQRYPQHADKLLTLPNGFDSDDRSLLTHESSEFKDKIVFSYVGTLPAQCENLTTALLNLLVNFKLETSRESSNWFQYREKLLFRFVGYFDSSFFEKAKTLGVDHLVDYVGPKDSAYAMNTIATSSVCLQILNEEQTYAIGTKAGEYWGHHKKTLFLSYMENAQPWISKENLGWWASPSNLWPTFQSIFEIAITDPSRLTCLAPSGNSISDLTQQLIRQIESDR